MPSPIQRPVLPLAMEQGDHGIVFAFKFGSDGRGIQVQISRSDALTSLDSAFRWIHINLTDARCRTWLASLENLPATALEVLLSQDEHDRMEMAESFLAGVFVDIRLEFAAATEDLAQLRFVLTEGLLVTGRRHALHSIESVRASVQAGQIIESPIELLETIVDREADMISTAVAEIGQAVDRIEDKILAGYADEARELISSLRQRLVRLNRHLSRLLGLFRRAERAPAKRSNEEMRGAAGRISQRLDSIHQDVQSSQERARLLQDEVTAHLAAETNRQLYVLSMLTAVFLPATLITGLFGMNTKGLPFAEDDAGFWLAGLIAVAASIGVYLLLLFIVRRRKLSRSI